MKNKFYEESLVSKNNELLDLINDENKKTKYFKNINQEEFTNERLKTLIKKYNNAVIKRNNNNKSTLTKFINKYYNVDMLNKYDCEVLICKSNLMKFEKNLSYLLYFDMINIEEAKNRKFDIKYIKKLLEETKIMTEPYYHFYVYDGANERQTMSDFQKSIGIRK